MLQLREITVPSWPFGTIQLFATTGKALGHLCDHVLTRPEADYWATLIPAFTEHLDPTDEDGLYRFARSLYSRRARWDVAQALYDGYTDVIAHAMNDAIRQGWYWAEEEEDGPCWRGLGMSGTYVIWRERSITTAMLLGYTSPTTTGPDYKPRRTNPLPRQHSWRYRGAMLRHDDAHFPPVDVDVMQTQYHVFKKGAVRVRREYKNSRLRGKVTGGGAYLGSLRDGVPDFDGWSRLRPEPRRCVGHGPHAFSFN